MISSSPSAVLVTIARRRTQQKVSEHTAINYSRTTYTIQQLEKVVWAETTEARPNLTNFTSTCFTIRHLHDISLLISDTCGRRSMPPMSLTMSLVTGAGGTGARDIRKVRVNATIIARTSAGDGVPMTCSRSSLSTVHSLRVSDPASRYPDTDSEQIVPRCPRVPIKRIPELP